MIVLKNEHQHSLKHKVLLTLINGFVYIFIFILINGYEESILHYLLQALIFGFFMVFGLPALEKLIKSKNHFKAPAENIDLLKDEKVLVMGPLDLYKNKEGAGGKMMLTESRLIFTSPKLSIQSNEIFIPLNKINKVEPIKINWLVQTVFSVHTEDKEFRFNSFDRETWLNEIEKQLDSSESSTSFS